MHSAADNAANDDRPAGPALERAGAVFVAYVTAAALIGSDEVCLPMPLALQLVHQLGEPLGGLIDG